MTYTPEQITELLSRITPGEWESAENVAYVLTTHEMYLICCEVQKHDAAFIAAAPEIVRQLLTKIEKQKSELDACWDVIGNQFGSMGGALVVSARIRLKDKE